MFTLQSMPRLFATLLVVGFALTLTVGFASAAPLLGPPATDGDGLMAISPASITYGDNTGIFAFTFTANADFGAGSQVKIDIPSGWTTPTTAAGAGHVSWNSGTCTLNGAPPVATAGMSIFIDITSCPTNAFFTVTYANVAPGAISGSPYTFVTWTDIGPGGQGLTIITAPSPAVSISPKTLTVSEAGLMPADKIYDSATTTALTIGSPTLVGIVGTDVVALVSGGAIATFMDPNIGAAKAVNISGLTLSGAQANNYTLTQPTRTANITKRAIAISAVTDTKTYDGGVSSIGVPTVTFGALQGSDTASWTQTFNNKHAGMGNKVLIPAGLVSDGNGGNNYSYTYTPFNAGTINKAAVTVTAQTDSRVYDGTTSSSGVPQVTPSLLGSDTPAFAQAFDTKNVGTGKTLTPVGVANDGNGGNNYAYTFVPNTTGVITAATPTLSVTNSPVTYNGLPQAAVVSSSVPGVVSNVQYNGSATTPTNVGVYTVTADFTPTDTLNYNSLLPGVAGSFVIAKATPTLSVTNSPVTYNGLPQAAVVSSSVPGAVSNVQYNGSATVPVKPGIYVITADFTSSDPNYTDLSGSSAGNFFIRVLVYLPLIIR